MSVRRHWLSFDFILLILVLAAGEFGIRMIGATASYTARRVVANAYTSQRLFFMTGIVILIIFTVVDYHLIGRLYWFVYALMIVLLIAVLIFGQGDATGTARWFRFDFPGMGFAIQPSEFSKIFMIVFLAKFIDKQQDSINNIGVLSILAALIIVPVVLILSQPALSACVVIAFISICVVFSSGLKARYILIPLGIIIPIVMLLVWDWNGGRVIVDTVLDPYQVSRIEIFLNPERHSALFYQSEASLRAIGSGMLHGRGYRQGRYVPMGENDFIFAIIGEQFGFIGCALVLLVFFIIITKCIVIANRAHDMLGKLIAMGVACKLAFEVFVNVGVATYILPNTGMPFPFLSAGGSSLWVNMACIGLVLNVGLFKAKSIFKG